MEDSYMCGVSIWHPKWLQRFATVRWYLLVYSLLGTIQGISFTYLPATLTTLQKRFNMPSQTTGVVLTGNEISQILFSLVLSYVGSKNRPQWIAWGTILCGISCFVLALPHFTHGIGDETLRLTKEYYESIGSGATSFVTNSTNSSTSTKGTEYLCRAAGYNEEKCNDLINYLPLVLIFASQFILGVGNTLYYALGQTYLDDSTTKKNMPWLLSVAMAMRMVGPTIGLFLGQRCLKIFIDPSKTPLISDTDPRWLGAWWLGWIILAVIMFIFSGLLSLFPKHMRLDSRQTLDNSLSDTQQSPETNFLNSSTDNEESDISVKDFFITLKRILRNKIVIFNNIAGIFYILGATGFVIYMGRIVEVIFHKPAQDATVLPGAVTMLGTVLGLLASGWVISRKRPAVGKVLFWNVIVGCICTLAQFLYLLLYCPSAETLMPWTNSTTCNENCHCDHVKYSPVCHRPSHLLFFSPCHAGCSSWDPATNAYANCSCITDHNWGPSPFYTPSDTTSAKILNGGLCTTTNCDYAFYTFAFLSLAIAWLNSTGKIGNILVNYRAVADKDKAFTQGLTLMMLSLFAFIPAPILYGRVIDNACLSWTNKCGKRGNCQLYDQDTFRYNVFALGIFFTTLGTIFDFLVWYYGRNMDLYGETTKSGCSADGSTTEQNGRKMEINVMALEPLIA